VLDTFAVIALVQDEPGAERVECLLAAAGSGEAAIHMCSVNVAEVLYTLWRRGDELPARAKVAELSLAGIRMHDADLSLCLQAGALKAQHPIALADCFAAALAQHLDATLVTGDPEFKQVEDVVRIEWL
jgi:predicted nucleic acid-binding protein